MKKTLNKYIIVPIKCKTEEYAEIEDYIEKGILTETQVKEKLNNAVEYRESRLNTDAIVGYYSNFENTATLIDIASGSVLTANISVEEIDVLIRNSQKNILNLWGILL